MPDIYLPIVNASGFAPYALGAQQEGGLTNFSQWCVPKRVYHYPIYWQRVEAIRGTYKGWWAYDKNAELINSIECPQIITVKASPDWAKAWVHPGSPPAPEYYADYAKFCQFVIDRYHPFALELWNEPDMERDAIVEPDNNYYGAWVDSGETFYQGGQRYGECMKMVTEQVTGSKILIGALTSHSKSIEFMQGAWDAGLTGDALSYHCYIRYPHSESFNRIFTLADWYRKATDLPLLCTETSMLAQGDTPDYATPEFLQMQADYLRYILDHMEGSEVELVEWFMLGREPNSWANSELIRFGGTTPVYDVWKGT